MDNLKYVGKLKNREAVNKLRHGGKTIREILRKRCREQIRGKRQELFNTHRLGLLNNETESINDTLAEIVRREFNDLSMIILKESNKNKWESDGISVVDKDISDFEEEISREQQLMLEAYEEMQQYDDDFINKFIEDILTEEVICPICQRAPITESFDGLICSGCMLKLPPRLSIEEFASALHQQLNIHNSNCPERANFAVLPENDTISLYLICDTCANFALIM